MRHLNACGQLAGIADDLGHLSPRRLLVELGHAAAGVPQSGPGVWIALLAGGRNRLRGGGFRPELRDRTAGQARHFAGTARAVTLLGAERTRWLSVHVRRDALDSPDGRLGELAIAFATALLDGELPPAEAGAWIRAHVCDRGTGWDVADGRV